MLIVTSLFKPDTVALLPRKHRAHQPTPATALTPRQHRSSPSNATAHPLPPSSLPATDAPSPLRHHRSTPTAPLLPQQCRCAGVALPPLQQLCITQSTAVDTIPPGHRDIVLYGSMSKQKRFRLKRNQFLKVPLRSVWLFFRFLRKEEPHSGNVKGPFPEFRRNSPEYSLRNAQPRLFPMSQKPILGPDTNSGTRGLATGTS